jgi:hypothetical protein
MRTTRGLTVCLGLALLFLASHRAWAKQGTVVTNAGATVTGEVVAQDDTSVTLNVAGAATVFKLADVKSLTILTPEQEFAQRRAKLADTDIKGRLDLAQWLYDQGLLDLAKRETADLRQRAPDNEDAVLLARLVDKAIDEKAQATVQPPTPAPGVGAETPGQAPGLPAGLKMLTPADINTIKIWEIDFASQPHVTVPSEVIDTLFKSYSADPAVPTGQNERTAFRTLDGYKQLRTLFEVNADKTQKFKDFYSKIKVVDDPPAIKNLKKQFHQNYVLGYCGSASCHGGAQAGNFFLFQKDAAGATTVYTNFYILQNYVNRQASMIDHEHPELSLLIQYGMAQSNATFPHPVVPGWKPRFTDGQEQLAQSIGDWIKEDLGPSRPRYPINYTPPQFGAASPDHVPPAPPAPAH